MVDFLFEKIGRFLIIINFLLENILKNDLNFFILRNGQLLVLKNNQLSSVNLHKISLQNQNLHSRIRFAKKKNDKNKEILESQHSQIVQTRLELIVISCEVKTTLTPVQWQRKRNLSLSKLKLQFIIRVSDLAKAECTCVHFVYKS